MSKEHAYAYEAGYVDGSTHYELEHCPACKNVADLQEALAENAKLRELVEILVHCMDDADGCDTCPVNGNPYDVRSEWAACDSLRELLNDVGVMVE